MEKQEKINIFDVANYILTNNKNNTHMKLHKLIFYSHVYHLTKYKKPLIENEIQAWRHGPVFPELYPILKEYTYEKITKKIKNGKIFKIKNTYKKAIDYIINKYGKLDGQQLSEKTHFENPWQEAIQQGKNVRILDENLIKYYIRKNKL
ncbi:Panacea domain-containing protein [Candidatus Phytoplasma phoenicium]|uniref:Antitoxin SocA-like Panacea domain-containing protein n=1 Tax=Candidatus Phytoplasma phoenicium TaxID=198422 RepID=A0A0L0MJ19_9MOLU|nr:type II toxin-antitoxin system antitoxin SocA domain-containing protein [Candidatus Phytoplasma phoenicium]KND62642.1 hypothetical protein, domain of unknown function DUF4065 [Candidatus Phytoplasma phoenicium]